MEITRRILAVFVAILPVAIFSFGHTMAQSSNRHYLALVGTYTTKTNSKGIYALDFDANTGTLTPKGLASEAKDPSWVVVHPNGKFVYAANEAGKESMVSAFALDAKSGKLKLLNQLPSEGEDPCYLSIDKEGKALFVANYTSGTVSVFPILADGKLGPHTSVVKDAGTLGPNKERQESPHAHFVEPSDRNRFVYVADLALDKVLVYEFDASKGVLTPGAAPSQPSSQSDPFAATVSPGSGPRHVTWSGDGKFMYVLGEMKANVTVFANDSKTQGYKSIQDISALPANFKGTRHDGAEIAMHPSGKFLYASIRGADTIALFAVDHDKGTLRFVESVSAGGEEPRHFAIDPTGKFLLAEAQNSNLITVFRIDEKTGRLQEASKLKDVPSPVCLTFYPAS